MNDQIATGARCSLSVGQRSRWFYQQLHPAVAGALNSAFAVTVHGSFPLPAIADALHRLIQRHPTLRVHVSDQDGEPVQTVIDAGDAGDATPAVIGVEHLSPAELQATLASACARSFHDRQQPLIHATVFRTSAHESILLLVFDHLVVDGWSYWQLLEEFRALLSGDDRSPAQTAGTSRPAYFDYVDHQRTWLASPQADAQRRYWREQLADLPTLQLPYDRPHARAFRGGEGRVTATIPAGLVTRLKALARESSATLFVTLASAFQIFLHRHSGQDDIVIGVPMPGRMREAWDRIVGDFVNPVALRTRFERTATVASVVRDMRGTALRAMANQELPFSMIVEQVVERRDAKQHPIFQAMFAFQNARDQSATLPLIGDAAGGAPTSWGDMQVTPCPVPYSGRLGDVPLILEMVEVSGTLRCAFKYDPDRFDRDTIARMAARFERLLDDMAAAPARAIDDLELVPPDERALLLDRFSGRTVAGPRAELLHTRFEAWAAERPGAIAVVCDDASATYGELNARANRIAHRLIARGVRAEDRVAICLERGVAVVAGILGIVKAGGVYVPIDPSQPAARVAHVLADCSAVALITQRSLRASLPAVAIPVVDLDAPSELAALDASLAGNPDPSALGIRPDQLAYIIYTSGSTGQPKGVMIEHAGVPRIFGAGQPKFRFGPDDVWTVYHSFGFDFSVWEMWGALLHGGRLVIVPTTCARDPWSFYDLLCRERVTVLNQTPSAFRQLVAAHPDGGPAHSLRLIIFAGEAIELHTIARWFEHNDRSRTTIVNMYGATESTVHATYYAIPGEGEITVLRGVCGRPLPGYRIYVLDARRQPVPVGMTGEIYIGGACVARGYMNRPELTAERFHADPFAADTDARLYRTGDLGRFTADGALEFLGRNDFQVKIRGFRIELGEIEARLHTHPNVRQAVVLAREDAEGDKRLVAYVVPKPPAEPAAPPSDPSAATQLADLPASLRRHLASTLPDYMVPAAFVVMDALPLNGNGKLERSALPPPDDSAVTARAYEAPEGEVERTLAGLWASALGIERVGRHDQFFELGGHSLLAIQLISRIAETFEVQVSLRSLFENPSIGALADVVISLQLERYADADLADLEAELRALPEHELRALVAKGAPHE